MRLNTLFTVSTAAVLLFCNHQLTSAQSNTPKFEIGAQFSTIRFSDLDITEPGFGGRFTYNVNSHVGLEVEMNFFREKLRTPSEKHFKEVEKFKGYLVSSWVRERNE
jgi:hypothetical protein